MNISSIWYENLYKLQDTKTQSGGNAENSQSLKTLIEMLSNGQDDVSFSAEGMARLRMPPRMMFHVTSAYYQNATAVSV